MHLSIVGYKYQKSSNYLAQGVKNNRRPRRAVAGGNGSYVMADPPQILVDVKNTKTGEVQTVNMYYSFKEMMDGSRMSEAKAGKIIALYRKAGEFEAFGWDEWEILPGVYSI